MGNGSKLLFNSDEKVDLGEILKSIPDAVFTMDRQMRINYFSTAAERMTGFPAQQAQGMYCKDVLKTDMCDTECSIFKALQIQENIFDIETFFKTIDNEKIPILISASIIRDSGGKVCGFAHVFKSISGLKKIMGDLEKANEELEKYQLHLEERVEKRTSELRATNIKLKEEIADRKQTETKLQRSQRTLETILNSMPNGVVIIGRDKRIRSANHAVLKLMGYESEDEIAGMVCHKTLCPAEVNKCPIIDLQQEVDNSERVLLTKEGGQIPILKTVVPVEINGEAALLESFVDITGQKIAEEELKAFAKRLEQSNQELQDFAYIASHDLQEPLRKVTAFGDRLKAKCGDALNEQGRDYLDRMQNAAGRMQTLVEGLLTYSRITTKGHPFVPVDLAKILQEVVSDLEVRIEQTGGRIEIGDLPTIAADPLQMRQLLQNLIGNALKFHRKEHPPIVKIHSKRINGEGVELSAAELCQITVADNGIGFDEKYGDRIFGVFQRLHGRNEYEGAGIGLSVCRKIVKRHGGSITAISMPGQGATFIATLPVKQPKEEHNG